MFVSVNNKRNLITELAYEVIIYRPAIYTLTNSLLTIDFVCALKNVQCRPINLPGSSF